MKLRAVVDSLEGIEETVKAAYTEFDSGDGKMKFRLNLEGATDHPDTLALKNAHERTKATNRDLTAKVSTLEEKLEDLPEDFDRDLYDRAKEQGVGGSGGEPKDAEKIREEAATAATKRAEDRLGKDITKLTGERDKYKTLAYNQVKRAALDEQLDAIDVIDPPLRRGARALLLPLIEVHEQDGELVALAKDPAVGDTLPVADYVKKTWAQTDEGKAYRSVRESAGGGAKGGDKGNGNADSSANPFSDKGFNVTEQARLRREEPEKAVRLQREAGVAVTV